MTYYDPADVMRTLPLKPLSEETQDHIGEIKNAGRTLYDLISEAPPSREMSLAKTKLEESIMWAIKGITA